MQPSKGKKGVFARMFARRNKSPQKGKSRDRSEDVSPAGRGKLSKKDVMDDNPTSNSELPTIIKQTIKSYATVKTAEEKKEESQFKKKKKKRSHSHGEIIHLKEEEEAYVEKELKLINTPYCNFSNSHSTIQHYNNILNLLFGKMTPLKLQVQCTLYHGCEVLTEGVVSDDVYFNNTVNFNQWITFGNLRVS